MLERLDDLETCVGMLLHDQRARAILGGAVIKPQDDQEQAQAMIWARNAERRQDANAEPPPPPESVDATVDRFLKGYAGRWSSAWSPIDYLRTFEEWRRADAPEEG